MKVEFRAFCPADCLTIRAHMPYAMTESTSGIVAYDKDTTETLALFVGEDWTATSCSVHIVIIKSMVLRHGWLEAMGEYMFTRAARKKLYAVVPDNHKKSLRLVERLGFKQVARLEDAVADGIDYLVMELKREDYPYWGQPALRMVS